MMSSPKSLLGMLRSIRHHAGEFDHLGPFGVASATNVSISVDDIGMVSPPNAFEFGFDLRLGETVCQ